MSLLRLVPVLVAANCLLSSACIAAPVQQYPDLRPAAPLRMTAKDEGRVLRHGHAPEGADKLGARDVWVWQYGDRYFMHYDAAGPQGWLVGLAESNDLIHWTPKGTVLDLGTSGSADSASASYGTTYKDPAGQWHMFYLGTQNTTPPPNLIPALPYVTLKAHASSPTGPWTKNYAVRPFAPAPGTYYSDTASPGAIIRHKGEYLQYFSAAVREGKRIRRTLGLARTKDLNGPWTIDPHPILPLEEQIENSSLYFEPANQTWFLFTNHVGITEVDGGEYTDAIWMYWSKDPTYWDARHKAVVLDGENCTWSKRCIGLPSVVPANGKLAIFYDAPGSTSTSHMKRDVGLAWLDLPLAPPGESRVDLNPAVESGLEVLSQDGQLVVTPGRARINGKVVSVESTATLAVPAGSVESVRGEEHTLPAVASNSWVPGDGRLEKTHTTTMIPGALLPASLKLHTADGTLLVKGKDYVTDDTWSKIALAPGSTLTTGTKVAVDYDYGLLRVDGIDISPDGKVTLAKGEPHLVCPVPAPTTTSSLRLANIFRPYGCPAAVEPWHIFVVGRPFPEPTPEEQRTMSAPVSRTLQKLREGKPVTIVTWGDSVTVGGDVSSPEKAYANLFISSLRERFPNAKITHVNASIGGTTTEQRLPAFDEEVLSHKPDLVTIEFVNDMGFPVDKLRGLWDTALDRITSAGAEAVVITPHFTVPSFMGNEYPRGTEMREDVRWLKLIARQHNVGLADTSRRWEHLESEGIPYITLLWNGINHPNDYGHTLFVKDLMNLFPKE